MPKSKTKKTPGEHGPIDFLDTGCKVTTICAFSVKILENYKLRSDHLASGASILCIPPLHASLRQPKVSARKFQDQIQMRGPVLR